MHPDPFSDLRSVLQLAFVTVAVFICRIAHAQSEGSLDVKFGENGILRSELYQPSSTTVVASTLDGAGRILVTGATQASDNANIFVARYTALGRLDSSFGTNGIAIFDLTPKDEVGSIQSTPSGRILLACDRSLGGNLGQARVLAVFDSTGHLDTSFAHTGSISTTQGSLGYGVTELEDGSIIMSGACVVSGGVGCCVTKYLRDGRVDSSYGVAGVFQLMTNNTSAGGLCLPRDNGKVLIAGIYVPSNSRMLLLMQLDAKGRPDSSFGQDGIFTKDIGPSSSTDLSVASDSSIFVAFNSPQGPPQILKISRSGIESLAFGSAFRSPPNGSIYYRTPQSLMVDDSGRIYLALVDFGNSIISRWNPDGSIDTAFGYSGTLTIDSIGNRSVTSLFSYPASHYILASGFEQVDYQFNVLLL